MSTDHRKSLSEALPEAPEGLHFSFSHSGDESEVEVTITLNRNSDDAYVAQRIYKVGPSATPDGLPRLLGIEAGHLLQAYKRRLVLEAIKGAYKPADELEVLFQAPSATHHPLPKEVQ